MSPLDEPATRGAGPPAIAGIGDLLPAIVEALADAIAVADRERRIVATNRHYAEVFGDVRADLMDSACSDARHRPEPEPSGPPRCPVCEVLAGHAPQRRSYQVPDSLGAMRRYEATFTPIGAGAGEVTHVLEVWRDVTERSRLEVQLSHSERLASVGMLSSGVAHEINNPLASLLAGAEALSRWLQRGRFDAEGVAEAAETLEMLEREIERCRGTTEKLVLLGRPYDAEPSWFDLNRAARDTLSLLGYEMRRHGIESTITLEPSLPQIWAGEAAIRGVCMNLMMNAVQAMSGGGKLSVTTANDRDYVRLTIEDTGPGIAPEHLERIWDPFFTTKPVGQGTGLGLSITHRIVSRHGGRIAVHSAPGRGARFEVELPVHGTGGKA